VLERCPGPADAQLAQVQDELKCGTNCGSCVPEIRRIVQLKQSAA
jgi:assimilatory nitrate reductase catalytic subunit